MILMHSAEERQLFCYLFFGTLFCSISVIYLTELIRELVKHLITFYHERKMQKQIEKAKRNLKRHLELEYIVQIAQLINELKDVNENENL